MPRRRVSPARDVTVATIAPDPVIPCPAIMGQDSTPALTPELRQLADRAVERALAALHAAAAKPARGRSAPASTLEGRLAQHLGSLPAPARARLAAPRAVRAPTPTPTPKVRPLLRWPSPLPPAPASTTPRAFDLRLTSLRCDDDTREVRDDEMSIGLVRITLDHGDPVTQATEVQGPFTLGKFRKGDTRNFSPAPTLTTVMSNGTARTVTSVLVLAEIDFGGLDGLLSALAAGVTDELILEIAQRLLAGEGAIIGATFFGTLGSIFGPVGTAGGIVLGVALGAAVGYAVGKAIEGLLHLFKDDTFEPREWTIEIPDNASVGLHAARQFAFTGHGAAYTAALEWRVR